jgi:hypothetical protein
MEPGESGRGLPQSKTWRKFRAGRRTRSVLDCASPLALWNAAMSIPDAAGAKRVAPQSDGRAGARVSPPAAASPDVAARDSLDADWTVHALRLGQPRSECRRRNGSRRNQMDD